MPSIRKNLRTLTTKAWEELKKEIKAHAEEYVPSEEDIREEMWRQVRKEHKQHQRRRRRRQINDYYNERSDDSQAVDQRDVRNRTERPRRVHLSQLVGPSSTARDDEGPMSNQTTLLPSSKVDGPLREIENTERKTNKELDHVKSSFQGPFFDRTKDAVDHADEYRQLIGAPSSVYSDNDNGDDEDDTHWWSNSDRGQDDTAVGNDDGFFLGEEAPGKKPIPKDEDLGDWKEVEDEIRQREQDELWEMERQRTIADWIHDVDETQPPSITPARSGGVLQRVASILRRDVEGA